MNTTIQRLKRELKTEKRKAVSLALLGLVGLLLWGKLLIPTGTQEAAGQNATAINSMDAANGAEAGKGPIPQPPDPAVVRVALRTQVQRDPFRIDRQRYEPAEPPETEPDDQREKQRRMRRSAILAEAEKLTLQSTLIGQQPQAIINGTPVAPGQSINGFRVLEVRSRLVRLVKQEVEVTLRIRSD